MAKMFMPAIKEALDKIENQEDVNFIRSARNEKNKKFLIAGLVGGEKVKLTKDYGFLTYPFEPILSFSSHLGDSYCSNFAMLDEHVALNWHNLANLNIRYEEDAERADIVASFKDGTTEELYSIKSSRIAKEEKPLYEFMQHVLELQRNYEDIMI